MTVTASTMADSATLAWTEEFIMIGLTYDPFIQPQELIAGHRFKPINDIPREEMLKKNSFPSVNENKFLTAWLKQVQRR